MVRIKNLPGTQTGVVFPKDAEDGTGSLPGILASLDCKGDTEVETGDLAFLQAGSDVEGVWDGESKREWGGLKVAIGVATRELELERRRPLTS